MASSTPKRGKRKMETATRVKRVRSIDDDLSLEDMVGSTFTCSSIDQTIGDISDTGIVEITRFLQNHGLYYAISSYVGWKVETERGKFAKRYAKFCRENSHALKQPTDNELASLGQLAEKYSIKENDIKDIYFKVVKPPFDFMKTGFGHPATSCWFGTGNAPPGGVWSTQLSFYESLKNVYGIPFFNNEKLNDKGYARLWAWQFTKNGFIVFNGYVNQGKNTLVLADALCKSLNLKKVKVKVDGHKMLYINEAGYYLYPSNESTKVKTDLICLVGDKKEL